MADMPDFSEFESKPDMTGFTADSTYRYMYYKKPNGWICAAPADTNAMSEYAGKGFIPLTKYGKFVPSEAIIRFRWWKQLLEKGGAKEFCPEQIVQMGWHKKPPVAGMVFPAMEGVEVFEDKCAFCGKKFSALTLEEVRLNKSKHTGAIHPGVSQNQQLAEKIGEVGIAQNAPLVDQIAQMLAELKRQNDLMMGMITKPVGQVRTVRSVNSVAVDEGD